MKLSINNSFAVTNGLTQTRAKPLVFSFQRISSAGQPCPYQFTFNVNQHFICFVNLE